MMTPISRHMLENVTHKDFVSKSISSHSNVFKDKNAIFSYTASFLYDGTRGVGPRIKFPINMHMSCLMKPSSVPCIKLCILLRRKGTLWVWDQKENYCITHYQCNNFFSRHGFTTHILSKLLTVSREHDYNKL